MPSSKLIIDKEVDLKELSIKNISELELLQPFGSGNEEPLFLIKDVKIKQIIPLCGGKYVKLRVVQQEKTSDLLCFSTGIDEFFYKPGESIDVVVSCRINYYNNQKQVTIKVLDIAKHNEKNANKERTARLRVDNKKRYNTVIAFIPRELGERFRTQLKKDNMSIIDFVKRAVHQYLGDE